MLTKENESKRFNLVQFSSINLYSILALSFSLMSECHVLVNILETEKCLQSYLLTSEEFFDKACCKHQNCGTKDINTEVECWSWYSMKRISTCINLERKCSKKNYKKKLSHLLKQIILLNAPFWKSRWIKSVGLYTVGIQSVMGTFPSLSAG